MTLPLPEDEWKLKVNAQYQEGIKLLMSFVTAGLVLPIVLERNSVGPDEMAARFLTSSAYIFWVCLFVSLLCGMLFYWSSSKFVKVVCGGTESLSDKHFEFMRDVW